MLVEGQKKSVVWHYSSKRHYELLDYKFTKYSDSFIVDAEHLSHGSQIFVKVECDYCGAIKEIRFATYYRNVLKHSDTSKYACKKCQSIKGKETSKKKYGCHFLQTKEGKQKRLDGIIDKHGVESVSVLEDVKQKKANTFKENYGKEHYFQTDEFKDLGTSPFKLTDKEVKEILAMMYLENLSTNDIYERLGKKVCKGSIRDICYGRTWLYVSKSFFETHNIQLSKSKSIKDGEE